MFAAMTIIIATADMITTIVIAAENVTVMTASKKKSSGGVVKKLNWFILGIVFVLGILIGIGGFWLYKENEDEVEEIGEKTEKVGDRLSTWGKDVGKSTKKLFK